MLCTLDMCEGVKLRNIYYFENLGTEGGTRPYLGCSVLG